LTLTRAVLAHIGARVIGADQPVFVIAEAGVNHDGSVARGHQLIDAAAQTGADAVKFQTFHTDALATTTAARAMYQVDALGGSATQHDLLRTLELPRTAWPELQQHATDAGLTFLSTPFDEESLRLLLELDVPAIKISSGDLTNLPLLRAAARAGRPLICSTGMATLDEVGAAVALVRREGADVVLLHCVSSYPAPIDQLNLRAIRTLAERFDVVTGFSDHSPGTLAPVAAVAAGAAIIEKHFTLDRELPGPDHRSSLGPSQFTEMVRDVRAVEAMLGSNEKRPQPAEIELMTLARRSLVYARDLREGTVLTTGHLIAKRPAGGLSPMRETEVLGKRLRRSVVADEMVALDDLSQ
jgi:N,N'-diacetyllegionaminate synthase